MLTYRIVDRSGRVVTLRSAVSSFPLPATGLDLTTARRLAAQLSGARVESES